MRDGGHKCHGHKRHHRARRQPKVALVGCRRRSRLGRADTRLTRRTMDTYRFCVFSYKNRPRLTRNTRFKPFQDR
eukprot:scaffold4544_cov66-Phaeocystis_antarctica.AAC.6